VRVVGRGAAAIRSSAVSMGSPPGFARVKVRCDGHGAGGACRAPYS
jgi:hypothetical protein